MYIAEATLDDLMRTVVTRINSEGHSVETSRGACREITGVLLELTNPRARLSSTETRGKLFSALGELCWYLAGSDEVAFIRYYIPKYSTSAAGCTMPDAYGPRLFGPTLNQIDNVITLLRRKPTSRRAVVEIFRAQDLAEYLKGAQHEVPCTCSIQFFARGGKLNALTAMRSNDAFRGIVHDIFAFTMLQEIIANCLDLGLGTYKHAIGSLHLYDLDSDKAQQFVNEGWQATSEMPIMPHGDPWTAVRQLLQWEHEIRSTGNIATKTLSDQDTYWQDLARLLLAFAQRTDAAKLEEIRREIDVTYRPFVDGLITRTKKP